MPGPSFVAYSLGVPPSRLVKPSAVRAGSDAHGVLRKRVRASAAAVIGVAAIVLASAATAAAAGPPYPSPQAGVRVYDEAGIFSDAAKIQAESTIRRIEERSRAQVAVYTQVVENGRSFDEANGDALALMNQWGVGRRGFDDGLVILFDMYPSLIHGQVVLYGGAGFLASIMDQGEKQRVFDQDMLPLLKAQKFDEALAAALNDVDAAATPDHAATLERARIIDAIAGLLVAPALAILLAGWAAWNWLRFGRDPVYLDDPSVHMAGPPEGLTPAAAAFVLAGGPTRRSLTAALLDLASRGKIAFDEEHTGLLGVHKKVGIDVEPAAADAMVAAQRRRNAARPLGEAEDLAFRRLEVLASKDPSQPGHIKPEDLLGLSASVESFDKAVEDSVVDHGWFAEAPTKVRNRWLGRAIVVGLVGGAAVYGGIKLPSNGLLFIGVGLLLGAGAMALIGRVMPAVTLPGAMIRAMLAAYRRTLKKTMDGARSMDQVVAEANLPWLNTPDLAIVWGTALGLHHEIDSVMARTLDDQRDGRVAPGSTYLPSWYGVGSGGGTNFAAAGGSGGGGLFSSSAVPNLGGMMAALGSIGNAPSSSGGGGFGGGGGGGGGGSGGGF